MQPNTPEQKEKNDKLKEIRHLANFCSCPQYISIEELEMIVKILKGEPPTDVKAPVKAVSRVTAEDWARLNTKVDDIYKVQP